MNPLHTDNAPPLATIITAMCEPCFELDSEEAALLVSAVDGAKARGFIFEPLTLALVEVLRRQLAGDDADFEPEGLEDDRCDDEDTDSDNDDDAESDAAGGTASGPGGRQIDLHTRAEAMATAASWLTNPTRVIQRGKRRTA